MKIPRVLTPSQVQRCKYMSGLTLASVLLSFCASRWEMVNAQANFEEGPYNWEGKTFTKRSQTYLYAGFITEYTNKDSFCTSWVVMQGTSLLPDWLMGIGYLLILLYIFIGISIAADIFMEAIEEITSKTQIVEIVDENNQIQKIEKPVWNATIANLSLMALGSSAPEILLAINDVVTKLDETPSELGPQSIVGSAAFNMFVISGVSIMAVTEVKKIFDVGVFAVTSIAATWAYVWFFLVLGVISPGEVEIWEAFLTVGFFIMLIILAYMADRYKARQVNKEDEIEKNALSIRKTALRSYAKTYGTFAVLEAAQDRKTDGKEIKEEDFKNIQDYFMIVLGRSSLAGVAMDELLDALNPENPLERIVYRKQVANASQSRSEFIKLKNKPAQVEHVKVKVDNPNAQVCFKTLKYSVTESSGSVSITLQKHCQEVMTFLVKTTDGSAKAPEDYEEFNELIEMPEGPCEHVFKVKVIDDVVWEPDKEFTIAIMTPGGESQYEGDDTQCTVVILDEDRPGSIGFKERFIQVRRKDEVQYVVLERVDGSDGNISCLCKTTVANNVGGQKQAVEGSDFVAISERIEFKHTETIARVKVQMPDCKIKTDADGDEDVVTFALELTEPTEGVKISKKNMCFIDIQPENTIAEKAEQLQKQQLMKYFMDSKEIKWSQQFKNAIMLGPKIDEDNLIDDVSCSEALMHLVSMPWKLVFALIPPKQMCGGWFAFFVALALIGFIVSIVGEFAGLLGCTLSIKTSVTAITLVALGTSLPDTFASKKAAESSEYADSAIGNVTGSNSVNVFLGMGLPWIIATIYHKVNYDQNYAVPAGSLTFSVMIFLICSMFCFGILIGRRMIYGGELGGPEPARSITGYCCYLLWFIYVTLLSLDAYEMLPKALQDDANAMVVK